MVAHRMVVAFVVVGALFSPSLVSGQSTWSGGNSAPPSSNYDRYGQPVAPAAPSMTQRAQSAFSDTSTTLRDGVEAGIRAAEQSFNTTGQTGVSNTRSSAASPWPSSAGSTTSSSGWTSIGTSIAAPPLLVPRSPMTTVSYGNTAAAGTTGPNYPAVASNDTQPLHSVLADPSRSTPASSPASNSASDWASNWRNDPATSSATIGRSGNTASTNNTGRDTGLVPLQTSTATGANDPRATTANNRTGDGWPEADPWVQNSQPTLGTANGTPSIGRQGTTSPSTNPSFANTNNGQAGSAFPTQPNMQTGNNPNMGNYNSAGMNSNQYSGQPSVYGANQAGMNGTNPNARLGGTTTPSETPWMPLVAAVLTLAGSLAANLYLGVSYLDARQKYQSLVRKTAETFRRVKAVAA